MTDKKTLYQYRIKQAEETLSDAENMLKNHLSPRSIINRAYYLSYCKKTERRSQTTKKSGLESIAHLQTHDIPPPVIITF
jgi:uncharacterized protein (UPF0332 family)